MVDFVKYQNLQVNLEKLYLWNTLDLKMNYKLRIQYQINLHKKLEK